MRFLTVEQMRAADRAASAERGLPGAWLMARAGAALARAALRQAELGGARGAVLVAGHGNNGGDACVAARALHEAGLPARLLLACAPDRLTGDAAGAWEAARAAGVRAAALAEASDWPGRADDEALALAAGGFVVVDGVLGTGCRGAPSGVAAQAIRWINRQRPRARVVAADLPSGLNGDTGEAAGEAVRADVTVTFARPKRGFLAASAAERLGALVVADIGIPDDVCDRGAPAAPCRLIAQPEVAGWFAARPREGHKGAFGHVCVLGGSAAYPHAPVLAALGALRSGAGLVTLAVPEASRCAAAAHAPEAILSLLPAPQGALAADALDAREGGLAGFDAVVLGPGLSAAASARGLVERVLAEWRGPLVLDADGLNALARLREAGWRPRDGQRLALTPHPGEAARLLGVSAREVQADRPAAARELAARYRAVVALKGAGTLVCGPEDGEPWLNLTGNPGLAAGGTGDVLAGMVGALWAQGLDPARAACAAVWAHGTAGDEAAAAQGQLALGATALAGRLGSVWLQVERGAC